MEELRNDENMEAVTEFEEAAINAGLDVTELPAEEIDGTDVSAKLVAGVIGVGVLAGYGAVKLTTDKIIPGVKAAGNWVKGKFSKKGKATVIDAEGDFEYEDCDDEEDSSEEAK